MYKRGGGFELGTRDSGRVTREQIQLAVRVGLELRASGLQVQRSNRSATLPPRSSTLPRTWQARLVFLFVFFFRLIFYRALD